MPGSAADPVPRAGLRAWLCALLLLCAAPAWAQFDHSHAAWNALARKHVRWLPDNVQSRVDYAGFKADRAALKELLDSYSSVPQVQFDRFTRDQQMAFLINAYNAFTVELILTKYPDLKSIKDLGTLLRNPWKIEFFKLLGEQRSLDWIEHDQLRPRFGDARVHAAVNCASVGCPALRDEAFVATRLEAQLEDGMKRFLSDRTRNRVKDGALQVNPIFKWYRGDFETGRHDSLEAFFAAYAAQLSDNAAERQLLRERKLRIGFLDYDWTLNALAR
jgi:hypothetical protein